MRLETIMEVKTDITVYEGRIDYKELLRALAEFDEEIVEIKTTEEGFKIVSRDYEVMLRVETGKPASMTRIVVAGRANAMTMSLMKLAEKVNKLIGKILEAVKD